MKTASKAILASSIGALAMTLASAPASAETPGAAMSLALQGVPKTNHNTTRSNKATIAAGEGEASKDTVELLVSKQDLEAADARAQQALAAVYREKIMAAARRQGIRVSQPEVDEAASKIAAVLNYDIVKDKDVMIGGEVGVRIKFRPLTFEIYLKPKF